MGSICNIYRSISFWDVFDEGLRTTPAYGSEPIVRVRYGEFDDDPGGAFPLEMYMRKKLYEALLSGEASVDRDSSLKQTLLLRDKDGNRILPLQQDFCY